MSEQLPMPKIIDDDHGVTKFLEQVGGMRPDVASAAGDEDYFFHRVTQPRLLPGYC